MGSNVVGEEELATGVELLAASAKRVLRRDPVGEVGGISGTVAMDQPRFCLFRGTLGGTNSGPVGLVTSLSKISRYRRFTQKKDVLSLWKTLQFLVELLNILG